MLARIYTSSYMHLAYVSCSCRSRSRQLWQLYSSMDGGIWLSMCVSPTTVDYQAVVCGCRCRCFRKPFSLATITF